MHHLDCISAHLPPLFLSVQVHHSHHLILRPSAYQQTNNHPVHAVEKLRLPAADRRLIPQAARPAFKAPIHPLRWSPVCAYSSRSQLNEHPPSNSLAVIFTGNY